ncbi:MAG: type II toxin-antitoxin system HicB family antitoxin [Oscillospiraceae bacterium]|jgi:predicted RNase H-like HicB family nuclease|nr:type II toxin-antitoxin system HicB family antitoxin [Oscillospiraceae bacterium]
MKYVYPAVFHPEEEGGYSIYFPDIHYGATQGDTLTEGLDYAKDFLCLSLYDMEEKKKEIPEPSDIKSIVAEQNDIVTLILADTEYYRSYYENKLIKKTLNIPYWLNARATEANINFSQLLQNALRERLHIPAME